MTHLELMTESGECKYCNMGGSSDACKENRSAYDEVKLAPSVPRLWWMYITTDAVYRGLGS